MIAGIQSSRMNDQRAQMPSFPGLTRPDVLVDQSAGATAAAAASPPRSNLDDQFFEMLMRCQV